MTESTLAYIQNANFRFLEYWSVQYLIESSFSYNENFKLVRIGRFLIKNRTRINIQDDKEYQRVTIKVNNKGVVPRDIELGRNIGTKQQYLVSQGQFLMSKIDARNGAFGLVSQELNGAIVTNDFPAFDINSNIINPEFLVLITTTKEFLKFAQSCSSGTTNRQRIDIDSFLNVKIPLPPLEEQDRIVKAYNNRINEAERLEAEAKSLEDGIETYLFEVLGIEKNRFKKKKEGINLTSFSEIMRWDTLFLFGNIQTFKSKFDIVKLGLIILKFNESPENKSLRINTSDFPNEKYRYIGMENVKKDTGTLIDYAITEGSNIKSQTVKLPKGYFIYGKLRPYLNKYLINETDYNNIVCSSEFFVFSIKESIIEKRFFKYILSSKLIQEQIADKSSGARMPRINEDVFIQLNIPLPPMEIQNEIAFKFDSIWNEINTLRQSSCENKQQAIAEFESKIFMPCN